MATLKNDLFLPFDLSCPSIGWFFGRLDGWSVCLSAIISRKGRKLHVHAPIGALVFTLPFESEDNLALTPAADIFAFGMCALETTALELTTTGEEGTKFKVAFAPCDMPGLR